jgi:competence protein ComEC
MVLLALLLGVARCELARYADREFWLSGDNLRLQGRLEGEVTNRGEWNEAILKVAGVGPRVLVRGAIPQTVEPSSEVLVEGVIRRPKGATNPGQFDYAMYLRSRGIGWIMTPSEGGMQVLSPSRFPAGAVARARVAMKASLKRALPAEAYAVYAGMVFGDKASLEPDLRRDMSRAGLGHLLAVSGLHVGFVVAFGLAVCRCVRVGDPWKALITGLLTVGYCLLVGMSPSVVRATAMALCHLGRSSRLAPRSSFDALGLAGILVLTLRPFGLFDPGFQLSFTATWGLLALSKRLTMLIPLLPVPVKTLLAVTMSAQAAALPITLRHFGFVPLISLLTNPLVLPAAGFMVIYGLALATLGLVLDLPWWVSWPGLAASRLLEAVAKTAGSWDTGVAGGLPLPSWATALAWLVFLSRWAAGRRKAWVWGAACLVFLGLPGLARTLQRDVTLTALDVGHGDAIVITLPGGRQVLVDGGAGGQAGTSDTGLSVVVPYLRNARAGQVEAVFLSHPHDDHIGGLFSVFQNIKVQNLFVAACHRADPAVDALVRAATASGVRVTSLSSGDVIKLADGVRLAVLHPPERVPQWWSPNESSMVLRLEMNSLAILLTGDVEGEGERALLSTSPPPAAVLKVSHHGSRLASSEAFLETVKPSLAIISTGRNTAGHPHPDLIERLTSRGVKVFRTDQAGAITIVVCAQQATYSVRVTGQWGRGFSWRESLLARLVLD